MVAGVLSQPKFVRDPTGMRHLIATLREKALIRMGPFPFFRAGVSLRSAVLSFFIICFLSFSRLSSALAIEAPGETLKFLSDYISLHAKTHMAASVRSSISRNLLLESRRQRVPLYLAVAIVQQESGFDPHALNSPSQDYGLFQVHFPFWRRYFARHEPGGYRPLQPEDLFQIPVNVRVGLMILKHDLTLERDDAARGVGLYSGRKGESRALYVERVFRNEVSFLVFLSLREREARSVESLSPGQGVGRAP